MLFKGILKVVYIATTSFDKKFVVKTKKASIKLLNDFKKPETMNIEIKKNIIDESKETLALLKKRAFK